MSIARLYRLATVVCLALYSVFAAIFVVTAAIHGGDPALVTVEAFAYLCAQAALGVAAVGLGHLLRNRTPVLAPIAAGLLFMSAFGHAAAAGFMLSVTTEQAPGDPTHMLNLVAVPTMVGLVGGTIVLAIALFRAKLGVAWLGVVLLGWVVVEFGLSGMGLWASMSSAALLLVAFVGLAAVTQRSELRDWMTASEWMTASSPGADVPQEPHGEDMVSSRL